MPRRVEGNDYWQPGDPIYEGIDLSPEPKPKIVFGVHGVCPSCSGSKVRIPMPKAEKRARAQHMKKKNPGPWVRWLCLECQGSGLVAVSQTKVIVK